MILFLFRPEKKTDLELYSRIVGQMSSFEFLFLGWLFASQPLQSLPRFVNQILEIEPSRNF